VGGSVQPGGGMAGRGAEQGLRCWAGRMGGGMRLRLQLGLKQQGGQAPVQGLGEVGRVGRRRGPVRELGERWGEAD
jgi:hypothetical protein